MVGFLLPVPGVSTFSCETAANPPLPLLILGADELVFAGAVLRALPLLRGGDHVCGSGDGGAAGG